MKTSHIIALAAYITRAIAAPAIVVTEPIPNPDIESSLPGIPITELEASNSNVLFKRQYSSDTYNQLTDGTACRPVTVLYARGTTQAGNVGDAAAVGPVFFNNLASKLGGTSQLAVQGVTYAASIIGFLAGGDAAGSTTLANLVSTAVTQCPSTKIVLAGYSQGAQLVHNAAAKLSAANAAKISAVVVFGDPKRGQSFGSIATAKTLTICHSGDNICDGGIIVTSEHTNYQKDAPTAATFVVGKI